MQWEERGRGKEVDGNQELRLAASGLLFYKREPGTRVPEAGAHLCGSF